MPQRERIGNVFRCKAAMRAPRAFPASDEITDETTAAYRKALLAGAERVPIGESPLEAPEN
jgi:hypothetical protein